MKSATVAEKGHPLPLRIVVPTTNATFPSVALMLTDVLVASAGGSAAPIVGLDGASLIRKYCPGATVPEVRFIVFPAEKLPAAEAYSTMSAVPPKSTVVAPLLKISTKSFWKGAPLLLPPP